MQSLWMIVASLLFACMGVCVKLGSARFTTGELVFYRGLVGFVTVSYTHLKRRGAANFLFTITDGVSQCKIACLSLIHI